jgi:hypothetical protein
MHLARDPAGERSQTRTVPCLRCGDDRPHVATQPVGHSRRGKRQARRGLAGTAAASRTPPARTSRRQRPNGCLTRSPGRWATPVPPRKSGTRTDVARQQSSAPTDWSDGHGPGPCPPEPPRVSTKIAAAVHPRREAPPGSRLMHARRSFRNRRHDHASGPRSREHESPRRARSPRPACSDTTGPSGILGPIAHTRP